MIEPVLYWNRIGMEANKNDHSGQMRAINQRGPTLSARALAMLHIAMHDACVPYYGDVGYERVLSAVPPPPVDKFCLEHVGLAISAAACAVLTELYPSQADQFDEYYRLMCTDADNSDGAKNAIEFGATVGKEIYWKRADDKGCAVAKHSRHCYHGNHKDDPFNSPQSPLGEDYGQTRHFALTAHLPLAVPPGYSRVAKEDAYKLDPDSPSYQRYLDHFDEVKDYGARRGGKRDIAQTVSGICWAYDGVNNIGAPPRLYNQIAVHILSERAKCFAPAEKTLFLARSLMLLNVAMADAATEAWFHKFTYDVWRPVVGIREHKGASNKPTIATLSDRTDPFWEPLGAPNSNSIGKDFTPPFPAYPSGHATFGAAAFETLRRIAGFAPEEEDDIQVTFVSDEMNGQTKDSAGAVRPRQELSLPSLVHAMLENGISRVYLGVHWRFDATTACTAQEILDNTDNIGGIPLGRAVAQHVFGNLGGIKVPESARATTA